jgi:hypothetical protein
MFFVALRNKAVAFRPGSDLAFSLSKFNESEPVREFFDCVPLSAKSGEVPSGPINQAWNSHIG